MSPNILLNFEVKNINYFVDTVFTSKFIFKQEAQENRFSTMRCDASVQIFRREDLPDSKLHTLSILIGAWLFLKFTVRFDFLGDGTLTTINIWIIFRVSFRKRKLFYRNFDKLSLQTKNLIMNLLLVTFEWNKARSDVRRLKFAENRQSGDSSKFCSFQFQMER